MKKILDGFAKVVEVACVIIMCIMVVVVFLATAGRYTGLFSIPWSEECSRYCMMAIVYLGLMLASRNGQPLRGGSGAPDLPEEGGQGLLCGGRHSGGRVCRVPDPLRLDGFLPDACPGPEKPHAGPAHRAWFTCSFPSAWR